MRNFLFTFVCVFVSVITDAQTFVPVSKIAKVHKSFVAYGEGINALLTPEQYLELKDKGVRDYKIVSYTGKDEKSSFSLVVSSREYVNELLTVDSVGVADDNALEVYFTNGKIYRAKSTEWAKVLTGQRVAHVVIKSPYRIFESYEAFATAPVGFVENHGVSETEATHSAIAGTGVASAVVMAKKEKSVKVAKPQVAPTGNVFSVGGFKLIEQ